MADLAELTAAGLSDVIPGYVLSPLTLRDYGEMEREFEAQSLAEAKVAADGAKEIIERALDRIAGGRFSFGSVGFDDAALKVQNLPFLLYLSLRHQHKDVTREKAAAMLDGEDAPQIQAAILSLAGYLVKKKPEGAPAEPPTGESSSAPSSPGNPDSPTPTSPT